MTTIEPTTAAESLFRVTQLIIEASRLAEQEEVDLITNLAGAQFQSWVQLLMWQAVALLPDGLPADPILPPRADVLSTLEEAEKELRRFPIWEHPAGTTDLVIDLCDAISRTRAGAWV